MYLPEMTYSQLLAVAVESYHNFVCVPMLFQAGQSKCSVD